MIMTCALPFVVDADQPMTELIQPMCRRPQVSSVVKGATQAEQDLIMSKNLETPPDWQADALATDVMADATPPRRSTQRRGSGEFLLGRLLGKIFRTGTLHVQMPSGRSQAFGAGDPQIAVRWRRRAQSGGCCATRNWQ